MYFKMEIVWGILSIVGAAWLGWVSIHIINQGKALEELKRNLQYHSEDVQKQTNRIDSLLKTETEELKSIIENANTNWKEIAQSIRGKK